MRKESWLLSFAVRQLSDRAVVEDVIQELAVWALSQVDRGRVFNDSYLFLRFRSLLRDARRDWLRSSPAVDPPTASVLDRRLDAGRALDRIANLPDGELMIERFELGASETALRNGLSVGALHVRTHRFRQRLHHEFPEGIAA